MAKYTGTEPLSVSPDAVLSLGDRQDDAPTEIETVYGYLLNKFALAKRDGDQEKAERVFGASLVMRELWPDDCDKWEARFK